jgi:peptidoglycan/xylan/chitin deacetylase (PgdA/CDA1 family)
MLGLTKRLVSLGISVAYFAGREGMRGVARLFGRHAPRPTVVLTYHTVRETDLEPFASQVRYLRDHVRTVFADDLWASNGRPAVAVTFDDAFQATLARTLPVLAAKGVPATVFVPTGYLGSAAAWQVRTRTANRPSGVVMHRRDLEGLNPGLVRLGSHSVRHVPLAELEERELDRELTASQQVLETIANRPITMLSFPYGAYDARVVAAAAASGYEKLFSNVPVRLQENSGAWLVGRVNVSPLDWPIEFKLKALGAYEWLAVGIPLKRALMAWSSRGVGA